MATKRRKSVKASKRKRRKPINKRRAKPKIERRKEGSNVKIKPKARRLVRGKKKVSAKRGSSRSPLMTEKSGIKRQKRRKGLRKVPIKKPASGRRVTTKKTGKIPKGWVEQKRLPGFKALEDELKRAKKKLKVTESKLRKMRGMKKKLKITEKKLRESRVKRQVDLIRERNRKKRQNPRIIRALLGLGMAEQIKAIRQVLGTASDESEYWKLVKQIAEEMGITTYNVLLYMYVRD